MSQSPPFVNAFPAPFVLSAEQTVFRQAAPLGIPKKRANVGRPGREVTLALGRNSAPARKVKDVKEFHQQFEITAQPQNAGLARERVKSAAVQMGFVPPEIDDIEIAIGEAVTNAILYGSPSATSRIVIAYWFQKNDQHFYVEIRDQGHGFDASHIRDINDSDALGGRGLRLMRALMDQVLLHYDGSGMRVCLTKQLPEANRRS